jgi:4-hydroxybenzoate polyprenyltransferase
MRILEYLKLIRMPQWYKNLVIFLPLFFVGELLKTSALEKIVIGFIALCLISSTNYIINDIVDMKKDRAHPEKKSRPLAAKKVGITEAITIAVIFFIASMLIAYSLGTLFMVSTAALFILTLLYTLWLKNEAIADVMIIAVNFVIRAVAGAFVIHVIVSPWLIVCPFFLALFLAVGKRDADLKLMKGDAFKHKEVLKYYDVQTTNALMMISTTCLIIAYSLYAFSRTELMLLTLPFAIYTIFRYFMLVHQGSEIARCPEKAYRDYRIILGGLSWIIVTFIIFYIIVP